MAKTLEQLRRSLPSYPPAKKVDEEGDDITPGFRGNASGCPKFITDSRALLLRSAIPSMLAMAIEDDDEYCGKKPTEAQCLAIWEPAEKTRGVEASFIGCAETCAAEFIGATDVAIIRDAADRIVIVNPNLLAFMLHHLHPHELRTAPGARYFESPLQFHKDAVLVGLLMPMRYDVHDVAGYDLTGEPIELEGLCA